MSRFKQYLEAAQQTFDYANIEDIEDKIIKERLTKEQFYKWEQIKEKIASAKTDIENLLKKNENNGTNFWNSFKNLWFQDWEDKKSEIDRQDSEFGQKNNIYYIGITAAHSASGDEKRYGSTALQKYKVTNLEYNKIYKLVDNPNTEDEELINKVKEIKGKILLNVLDAKRRNILLDILRNQLNINPPSWLNSSNKALSLKNAFNLIIPIKQTKIQ
jgi:hypothetical protein